MTKFHASRRVNLATKDGSCSVTRRNLISIGIDDADVDLANPEILTVEEDEDGDDDDDVEIDI